MPALFVVIVGIYPLAFWMYQCAVCILSTSGLEEPRFVYEPKSNSLSLNVPPVWDRVTFVLIRKVFFAMDLGGGSGSINYPGWEWGLAPP